MNNTRICARGILVQDDKVYLIKENTRQNVDCWFIPGGGIESGESISEGLQRELSEELGVDKTNISIDTSLLGSYTFELKNGQTNVNLAFEVNFPIPSDINKQGEDKIIRQKLVDKSAISTYIADSIQDEFMQTIYPHL